MNVAIHISLPDHAFISSGYTPRSGLLDHMVILYLIFTRNHHTVFHNDRTILHFQHSSVQGFQFLLILTSPHHHKVNTILSDSSHHNRNKVATGCCMKYFFILLLL